MDLSQINIKEALIILRFILDNKNLATRQEILEIAPWGSSKTDSILKTLTSHAIILRSQGQRNGIPRRGRTETAFSLNPKVGLFIGVELSNYFNRFVLADFSGTTIAQKEYPPSYRAKNIVSDIIDDITQFLESVKGDTNLPLLGITFALHGLFHETHGQLFQPLDSNSTINFNLGKVVKEHFNLQATVHHPRHLLLVENFGFRNEELKNGFVLNLIHGNGIGLGISIKGEFIQGASNLAGEIGHIPVPGNTIKCYCGKEGCLRTLVSYRGIVETVIDKIKNHHTTSLNLEDLQTNSYEVSVEKIIDAALAKDTLCMTIIHETGVLLGSSLAKAVNLLNPDIIIVHSNLIRAEEVFKSPFLYHLETEALPRSAQNLKIIFLPYPPYSIASGASKHALISYLKDIGKKNGTFENE